MHSLYKQSYLPYLSVKLCPNCDELVPVEDELCPKCQYNFTSKEIKDSTTFKYENKEYEDIEIYASNKEISNNKIEEDVPLETMIKTNNDKFVFCDNCGAKIIGSQRYCGGCGAKVSKRICHNCKQIIDAHLTFCPLCGTKGLELESIEAKEIVEEPINNIYTDQPINFEYEKNEEIANENISNVEQVDLTNDDDIIVNTAEEIVEEIDNTPLNEVVNMGRKRLFIIVQLLVVALIAAIMVVVPLLTNEPFVTAMVDCFKGESSESIISIKSLFSYLKENLTTGSLVLNENEIKELLSSENGKLLFGDVSFIRKLIDLIFPSQVSEDYNVVNVSFFFVVGIYAMLSLTMLSLLITSFFGMFRKTPLKGKSLGVVVIALLVALVFVYMFNIFFNDFASYDSWLTYAFALAFLLWFIFKIVFLKESKKYKKIKRQIKNQKKMEKMAS